jgi:type IV pilus biogenesis protein CpaD/CtpE
MANRCKQIVLVALLGAALQGCSTTPRFNKHFGDSVRANLSAQVINPAAAANADPVSGVDGAAARAAHERYQRSFVETDHPNANQSLVTGSGSK